MTRKLTTVHSTTEYMDKYFDLFLNTLTTEKSPRSEKFRKFTILKGYLPIGERSYCEGFGLADVRQQEEQANEGLEQQCTAFNW